MESPSNPMLGLTDLGAVVTALKKRGIVGAVDSTIASPINQQPLKLGMDVVMHSATKYLSGHSDATAGVLVGGEDLINALWSTSILLGCHCSPHDAWLVGRGLKTLGIRMNAHNKAGLALATWLKGRREVADVFYPGLDRDQEIYRAQMSGGGGVVAFDCTGIRNRRMRCYRGCVMSNLVRALALSVPSRPDLRHCGVDWQIPSVSRTSTWLTP